jgi:DNA-binding protein Fis
MREYTQQALQTYFYNLHNLEEVENFGEITKTALRAEKEASKLQKQGLPPESEETQKLAAAFWEDMMRLTNGNMETLAKLSEQSGTDNTYLKQALEIYFKNMEGQK